MNCKATLTWIRWGIGRDVGKITLASLALSTHIVVALTLAVICLSSTSFAQTATPVTGQVAGGPAPLIRIGLVSGVGAKASHGVLATGPIVLFNTASPLQDLATIPGGQYTVKPLSSNQWVSVDTFTSFSQVPEAARLLGVPYLVEGGVKLVFTADPAAVLPTLATTLNMNVATVSGIGLYGEAGLRAIIAPKNSGIRPSDVALKIGTLSYRGALAFELAQGLLTPVNYIDLEHYLYGVIPKEISPSWPEEAIKAQVVSARTYALSNLGRFKAKGYDLTDDTLSQMYRGYGVEDVRSNAAVDATRGECAYYQGKRIDALFHSNSGGFTENSENVYINALPYLRGKEDPYSLGAPNDSWTISYTPEALSALLLKNGFRVGNVTAVAPKTLSPFGRVIDLSIEGTEGAIVLSKERMRSVFGVSTMKSLLFKVSKGDKIAVLSAAGQGQLPSGPMVIMGAEQITNVATASLLDGGRIDTTSLGDGNSYRFSGKGFGHGVGLSQYGAKKMAELGFGYKDILTFYYTQITIE